MDNNVIAAAEAQAVDWVIRQRDPQFSDWDAFADWLAEDDSHADIYDAIASLDLDLDALPARASQPEMSAVLPRRPTRRIWLGGAVAASLVAAISVSVFGPSDSQRIETGAGEHRTLALADGSRIDVNGSSVLVLDKGRPRFARIESGEAMFHVIHNARDPFVVEAGEDRIVDMGTAFNVARHARSTSVAVSEGVIAYNPQRQNVRVKAGNSLIATYGVEQPVVHATDINSVGGWRTGQLVYGGVPLGDVAQDLQRTAAIKVQVDADVAQAPFRGALIIGDNPAETVDALAALSGMQAEKTSDGWRIKR